MEFKDRLALFNSKVELLHQRSLVGHLKSQPTKLRVKWDRGVGWESSFTGPTDEWIEASVLTARQFLQDNDPISVRNVARAYQSSGIERALIDEFDKVRGWLNGYLDRESNLAVSAESLLTNRDILLTFIYGGLSHSSEPHHSRYRALMSSPFADLAKIMFVEILSKFISGVTMLATVNLRVLDPNDPRLSQTDSAEPNTPSA